MNHRPWLGADYVLMPRSLHEVLLTHARSEPEQEVCGILGADHSGLRSIYPVSNQAGNPSHAYLIGAEDQFRVFRHLRENAQRLGGLYHSHPFGPAIPSATDLADAAYPKAVYFIAARNDEALLRAWRLSPVGFLQLKIELI